MYPRASLQRCGKSRSPLGFGPQTFQPVSSRYTDCAIPDNMLNDHKTLLTSTRVPPNMYHAMPPRLAIAGDKKYIVEWTGKRTRHDVAWSRPSVITTSL